MEAQMTSVQRGCEEFAVPCRRNGRWVVQVRPGTYSPARMCCPCSTSHLSSWRVSCAAWKKVSSTSATSKYLEIVSRASGEACRASKCSAIATTPKRKDKKKTVGSEKELQPDK